MSKEFLNFGKDPDKFVMTMDGRPILKQLIDYIRKAINTKRCLQGKITKRDLTPERNRNNQELL